MSPDFRDPTYWCCLQLQLQPHERTLEAKDEKAIGTCLPLYQKTMLRAKMILRQEVVQSKKEHHFPRLLPVGKKLSPHLPSQTDPTAKKVAVSVATIPANVSEKVLMSVILKLRSKKRNFPSHQFCANLRLFSKKDRKSTAFWVPGTVAIFTNKSSSYCEFCLKTTTTWFASASISIKFAGEFLDAYRFVSLRAVVTYFSLCLL